MGMQVLSLTDKCRSGSCPDPGGQVGVEEDTDQVVGFRDAVPWAIP